MGKDFVPKSLGNLKGWLDNLKTRITEDGPTCGQTAAQVTQDTALVDTILTPVSDAVDKESAWTQAEGTARDAVRDKNKPLRDMLNRYKTATGWTDGMAESWGVKSHETTYDMNNHKPYLTAKARTGTVELGGRKPGFSSVTIQMRLAGTEAWTNIGVKINHFPFYDTTAPQTAGKPEKREYRALGYDGDQQVGQPSDIVTAVFSE